MSNGGIRIQDLLLPLLAGGASALSPRAGRAVSVGLGALGQIAEQRREQARLSDALAAEKAKQSAKMDAARRLGDLINASIKAPKESASLLGFRAPNFDPMKLALAQYNLDTGNPDAAAEHYATAEVRESTRRADPIISREHGRVRALDPTTGEPVWEQATTEYTPPTVQPKEVKITHQTIREKQAHRRPKKKAAAKNALPKDVNDSPPTPTTTTAKPTKKKASKSDPLGVL